MRHIQVFVDVPDFIISRNSNAGTVEFQRLDIIIYQQLIRQCSGGVKSERPHFPAPAVYLRDNNPVVAESDNTLHIAISVYFLEGGETPVRNQSGIQTFTVGKNQPVAKACYSIERTGELAGKKNLSFIIVNRDVAKISSDKHHVLRRIEPYGIYIFRITRVREHETGNVGHIPVVVQQIYIAVIICYQQIFFVGIIFGSLQHSA